jgi:hypothetical protein
VSRFAREVVPREGISLRAGRFRLTRNSAHSPLRRAALAAKSLRAALALALSTVAGFLAAFVALLPAAVRGGPRGRRVTSLPALRALAPEADESSAVDAAPAEQALPR